MNFNQLRIRMAAFFVAVGLVCVINPTSAKSLGSYLPDAETCISVLLAGDVSPEVLDACASTMGCACKDLELAVDNHCVSIGKDMSGNYVLNVHFDQWLGNTYVAGGGYIIIMEDDIL